MPTTDVVIIGAGHAGLAVSRCLTGRGVEHVVLERGRVAERWRTARWDSFRLITPNWMTRLPGWSYRGDDPDGFMSAGELVGYLDGYAGSFDAPVLPHTTVTAVHTGTDRFTVHTDRGTWSAGNVVLATGHHARAQVPAIAGGLPPDLEQFTAASYRNPHGLPDGAVLVVGASASGVQFANELRRSGREVLLAVGGHTRLPRRYRDRDILWWLDRTGVLDRTRAEIADPAAAARAAHEPSLQLAPGHRRLDLGVLHEAGVRVTGRLLGIDGNGLRFAADLPATTAAAEARLRRVLMRIDGYAGAVSGHRPDPPLPVALPPGPERVSLRRAGITSVVWATGLRPAYPWLPPAVLDECGRLVHLRGVTPLPGLFAVGLRFQHRRNSSFIDGARHDAAFLTDLIAARCRAGATR